MWNVRFFVAKQNVQLLAMMAIVAERMADSEH
jgi:hypothetical protein